MEKTFQPSSNLKNMYITNIRILKFTSVMSVKRNVLEVRNSGTILLHTRQPYVRNVENLFLTIQELVIMHIVLRLKTKNFEILLCINKY